eukprot:15454314-Alexandrium_andersonii.AAC.1
MGDARAAGRPCGPAMPISRTEVIQAAPRCLALVLKARLAEVPDDRAHAHVLVKGPTRPHAPSATAR